MITGALKRLIGADRPKVIAILAVTREEAASCLAHAHTAGTDLPIRVWCEESGDSPAQVKREFRRIWPALTIVSWSGKAPGKSGSVALKLLPLRTPPFRVVVRNEAGGFFPGRPGPILNHATRRFRDFLVAAAIRTGETSHSAAYGAGQRLRDVAKLLWSLVFRAADRLWSALLALLALLAPLVWPLAKAALNKAGGTHPHPFDLDPAPDLTALEFPAPDRRWRRTRLVQALEASTATFVVFRHPQCNADVLPLLEAAAKTNAFALARQAAYTGWRKRITTRHPFRILQPGEISRVLSPASSLLVIRRDALLRFGLPRAFTFGAALELLYRQAAAFGLKSYVLGGTETLAQEPAMALEDVEFALRRQPLEPRHPALSRGNIATSLDSPGFRGKHRVLVVSPYLPFPLSHGGAVRIYNLCRELSPEIDFILACFREANETVHYNELHQVFREVLVVDIDEKFADPKVPRQVREYRNSAMMALIALRGDFDFLQVEYTQMAEYLVWAPNRPVLLVEHDITFSLHRQLAESTGSELAREEARLWQAFEERVLKTTLNVWTMSGQDRDLAIAHGAYRDHTFVVPNGVDLTRFHPLPKTNPNPAVLFAGSFRHLPNLLAFETLRDTIFPAVRAQHPTATLHVIAGPDHTQAAHLANKSRLLEPAPGITIEGFVSDVRPAYQECDVVVIPLPVSAGTNIKLMEAMACGRAVVSTPVGCTGLELKNEEDLLIRELGPEFAAAISALLTDTKRCREMGQTARQTAENRFGWHAIAREAMKHYRTLLPL